MVLEFQNSQRNKILFIICILICVMIFVDIILYLLFLILNTFLFIIECNQ